MAKKISLFISLLTEMTEITDIKNEGIGVLFYDGTCRICVKWARRLELWFTGRGLELLPFELGEDEDEMRLRLNDGREFGGADAVWVLAGKVWWGLPLWLLAYLPGVLPVMRAIYRMIASSRHCDSGKCELEPRAAAGDYLIRKRGIVWVVGLMIVAGGWCLSSSLPAWGIMWVMAASQFLVLKVMVLSRVPNLSIGQRMLFIFLWPGMDAGAFFIRNHGKVDVVWKEGMTFVLIGLLMLWLVSGKLEDPVLAGWVGMLGLIAFLHFGVFNLVAGFWQTQGYGARPIMEAPWKAISVEEFWGRRWNRAFSDVARVMVFRPLSRKWGVPLALMAGFVFSGIVHELVITVPASAGYGLPTMYFLLQGAAVIIERRVKLSGSVARLWVWAVVLSPAYFLFSPVFMERVIVPFLNIINNDYAGLAAP